MHSAAALVTHRCATWLSCRCSSPAISCLNMKRAWSAAVEGHSHLSSGSRAHRGATRLFWACRPQLPSWLSHLSTELHGSCHDLLPSPVQLKTRMGYSRQQNAPSSTTKSKRDTLGICERVRTQ